MHFLYAWEPILIQQISIGFEAILERKLAILTVEQTYIVALLLKTVFKSLANKQILKIYQFKNCGCII